jgi:apolipoprotein D and lipocalin family protein
VDAPPLGLFNGLSAHIGAGVAIMKRSVAGFALAVGLAGAAQAAAPTPQKPVDMDRLMGRWYEILRTPNDNQKNCYAAYQEWAHKGEAYTVRQVCHRDSPEGREGVMGVSAKPINAQATEFEASFFGGIVRARYWITDHADDYSWMIATTEDGHFPKLLARAPTLPAAQQESLKQRMAHLGFNTEKLEAVGVQRP